MTERNSAAADSRAWLVEVQERAERATDGPWDHQPWGSQNQNGDYSGGEVFADGEYLIHDVSDEDGAFIASARTEHPAMVAALLAVLEKADAIEVEGKGKSVEMFARAVADEFRTAITEHLPKGQDREPA